MLFFLFYCVISVYGFGFQEALNTSECMIACRGKDDWCLEYCTQPTGNFELDQTVDREADANVTLHCRGTHSLVIKHNPASYVIELQNVHDYTDYTWSKATVSDGEFTMFKYLTADTSYRFRLYMLTQTAFTSPEISNWFLTYAVDYQPKAIKYISVAKFENEINDIHRIRAEIMFQPAQAPEKVTGFQTKSILKRSEISYDIAVKWNKPILQPDNYTLQFKSSVVKPRSLVVPGDAVEAVFLNIENIKSYEITVVAKSRGGVSSKSTVSRIIDEIPKMNIF